jgi:hypothetical protein
MIGLFILDQLQKKLKVDSVGLYRDDGLAVIRKCSGTQADRMRKQITQIFKSSGLKITVMTNLKTVNFLDATLDLRSGTHKPYIKPNDNPMYINVQSNHPPEIIKHIPEAVGERISTLSSSDEIFKAAAPRYNEALKSSGFSETITYTKEKTGKVKKNKRTRKVTWFNPPYSKSVKTNVGGTFLKLVARHFPRGHALHKIFNKNKVKMSYSCTRNIGSIIKSHNSRVTRQNMQKPQKKPCNCRKKEECPLRGECQAAGIVYKATVKTEAGNDRSYIGITGGTFKLRYANHKKSFKHEKYEKETELSKFIWGLKRKGEDFAINWEIVKKSNTNKRASGQCNLCMDEKKSKFSVKKAKVSSSIRGVKC